MGPVIFNRQALMWAMLAAFEWQAHVAALKRGDPWDIESTLTWFEWYRDRLLLNI